MCMVSLDGWQVLLVMVQANEFRPVPNEVTVVVGLFISVIAPNPPERNHVATSPATAAFAPEDPACPATPVCQ